jgi:small ligand-binding sensory domain FIST
VFGLAHAGGDGDWGALLDSCLARLGDATGATIGFVYATDAFATEFDAIVAHLRGVTGIDSWIGAVGVGIVAGEREYFDEPALAVMIGDVPAGAFRLLPPTAGEAMSDDTLRWAAARSPGVSVVHGDGRQASLADRLDDLADLARSFVVGGLGSSRAVAAQAAGTVGAAAISGVVFAPGVVTATGLSQGCAPLGAARHRITEAEGNVIHALDHARALDVLQADLATLPEAERAHAARRLHVALPLVGSDRNDYLVRNLVGIDPQSGAIAIGDVAEPGRELIFVRRDATAAAADLRRMARDTRARAAAPPRAALYFSCLARGPNLFGPGSREIAALRAEIGDVPLIGMFCDGEISNARLYGYTGVLALLA